MTRHASVRSYLLSTWGEPDREAEFEKDGSVVGVLKWRAGTRTEGVTLYATVGASDLPLQGVDPEHRQEYFVGLLPECDDIASPLAWLGVYAHSAVEALAPGHTYRGLDSLVDGRGFQGFLLFTPLSGKPAPIALPDGRHIEFLMTVPAFADELDFARAHGVDELLSVTEERQVPFWDPNRRSTFATSVA